jgi:hypothetical protein
MSTLTYTNSTFAPATTEAEKAPRKPLWRRFFDALLESQQRRADREIARFIASHGGLFTDDMERQIMRRLTQNDRKAV